MKLFRKLSRFHERRSRKEMEHDEDMLLERLAEYTRIASVDECRTAVERMRPKKPLDGDWLGERQCPNCLHVVRSCECRHVCSWCGQRLDWSEDAG